MKGVKGMVQVGGKTYRIAKLARGQYEAIRIMDDVRVGTFQSEPKLNVRPEGIDVGLMVEIALAAVKGGKITWLR